MCRPRDSDLGQAGPAIAGWAESHRWKGLAAEAGESNAMPARPQARQSIDLRHGGKVELIKCFYAGTTEHSSSCSGLISHFDLC
jgi:hypothetical protein